MRHSNRRVSIGVLAAFASLLLLTEGAAVAAPLAPAQPPPAVVTGAEELIGQPFPGANPTATIHSAHGVDEDGDAVVFWMTKGNTTTPAMLQVTDVSEQQVVFRQRVASGTAASAMAFSPADGVVYIAMTSGEFYSWKPGDAAIANLGTISPGQNIVSLAVSSNGLVYAGTAPGGLVFRYDPQTGESLDLGRINPHGTSIDSLSIDDQHLYVGSSPGGELSRFELATGTAEPLALPTSLGAQTSVQTQSLTDGHLIARMSPSNAAVVYGIDDLSVENIIPAISGQPISGEDPTGPYVYFRHAPAGQSNAIYKYNLDDHTLASFGWAPNVFPMSFGFADMSDQSTYAGTSIVLASTNGRLYTWSQESRAGTYLGESTLHGIPGAIQAVAHGPDGRVYAGGGDADAPIARIGEDDTTFSTLPGITEVDSLARSEDLLLIGSTGGRLSAYDTNDDWAESNPTHVAIGSGQDRIPALLPLGDEVALASIANDQGGAISFWNPTTGDIDTHDDLVAGQGVVSLAERDGIVYAGTTVHGASSEAVLFSFDRASGEVGFRVTPVRGATSINALTFDASGALWGIAGTELFSFDVDRGEVIAHERLFDASASVLGTDRALVVRPDGLYASADGRLVRIDPETWDAVMLADAGVSGVSEGADGNLYYSRHGQVFRWNFSLPAAITPTIPETVASLAPAGDGWRHDPVTVTLTTATPRASIEYALGDDSWQTYSEPVKVTADGEHVLRYRSRALEGHVERTRKVSFAIDALAPTTTVRQSDDVIVLTANDRASGVVETVYRINGESWIPYSGPFRVTSADAGMTVEFRSTDAAGNVEATRTHVVGDAGDVTDRMTDHGEQVQKTQVLASLTAAAPDGTPLGVYIVSGNANVMAEFSVINLRTNEPVLQTRLPHGTSSQRNIVQSPADGAVYFGTSAAGHIYRYWPGTNELEYLLEVPNGELVWGMDVGDDGTIWFGVYSSGKLYSLDPETNDLTDHGQAAAGEQYIDAIEVHDDTIYVGTQASAKLLSFDRTTGSFTEIAMPSGHKETAITEIDIRENLMFVSTGSKIHVRDLETDEWVDVITDANARVSPVSPHDGDLVYLRKDNQIHSYDLTTGELAPTGQRPNASPESWNWLPIHSESDPLLMMTYWNGGRTYGFSMTGGQGAYIQPSLLGAAAPLISLGVDTSGHVYSGAFLSPPGMGQFDPTTGTTRLLTSTSQVEGYGTFGDKLVFGRYPQGSVYMYDPNEAWEYGTNPKDQLELGDEQSRPQVFVQLDEETMAVASVPAPGTHGGAITLWKPEQETVEVHRDVIEDQTPVALALRDGVLLGGTSVNGGYGTDAVASSATLFAWDPATQEVMWEVNPIPGARFIAGFAVADDGMLWAVVDGRRVIEFDPDTQKILRTVTIDANASTHRFGENDQLLFAEGRLFGAMADRLFHLDTVTEEVTVLFGKGSGRSDGINNVHELVRIPGGDLYTIGKATNLFSYDLLDDVTAPEGTLALGETTSTGVTVTVTGADESDAAPTVQTRIGDGTWQSHVLSTTVEVPFGASFAYRVLDASWNASETGEFTAPDHPQDPVLLTSSTNVRAGDEVTVTGSGFPANTDIDLELRSEPVTLAQVTADSEGALSEILTIPADTDPGTHTLVAVDPEGTDLAAVRITVLTADTGGESGDEGTSDEAAAGDAGEGMLPLTGAEAGVLLSLGALLLVAGLTLVWVRRRRMVARAED